MSDATINPVTMAEVLRFDQGRYICYLKDHRSASSFVLHATARMFGMLAQVAGPIMEHYHSDLFHDAKKLEALVADWNREDRLSFYWSVNDTGTDLSTDPDYPRREFAFRCWADVSDRGQVKFYMWRLESWEN